MSSTSIQWTDRVWNPTTGCDRISPGCANCYARTIAGRFWATQYPPVIEQKGQSAAGDEDFGATHVERPREFEDVQVHDDRLDEPFKWRKPAKVFVNSMSDLFHKDIPDEFIDRVFAVMALTPQHAYQVLTKRPERMRDYVVSRGDPLSFHIRMHTILQNADNPHSTPLHAWPLPNVWLGVSVENQHFADERIPLLLQTPAAVRFISAEPLLAPIEISEYLNGDSTGHETGGQAGWQTGASLDWVIVGGESGVGARRCDVAWVRLLVVQCLSAGVPVFVKQLGPWLHIVGDKPAAPGFTPWASDIRLRDRKGGDPSEWPEDVRVREFPSVAVALQRERQP